MQTPFQKRKIAHLQTLNIQFWLTNIHAYYPICLTDKRTCIPTPVVWPTNIAPDLPQLCDQLSYLPTYPGCLTHQHTCLPTPAVWPTNIPTYLSQLFGRPTYLPKYSSVFRENRCPHLPNQSMVAISVMKLLPWKLGQGHQNLISYWSCPIYIHEACKFGNIPSNGLWDNMQTNTFWLKLGGFCLAVTLKIRSRSPKPIQLFVMSKCYIHANLVAIRQLVHEILCTQAPFGSNLAF